MKKDSFLIVGLKDGERFAKKLLRSQRKSAVCTSILLTATVILIFAEHLRIETLNEKIEYMNRQMEGSEPKGE